MEKAESSPNNVNELVVVSDAEFGDTEKVAAYREKILAEYTGVVFKDALPKEQPIRGRYGLAYIPLKDDAVPQRQKPFTMKGEREEAYKKLCRIGLTPVLLSVRPKWVSSGLVRG